MASSDFDIMTFAKALVDPDNSKRDKILRSLTSYTTSIQEMTELEMLRLWKSLYLCLWLSDKFLVQRQLAEHISSLVHTFSKNKLKHLFLTCYFRTILREWALLDQHRVEKFYYLGRMMIRDMFAELSRSKWKDVQIDAMTNILENEVLHKTPNGVRFHLVDIYIEELSAWGEELSSKKFLKVISPFSKALGFKTTDKYVIIFVLYLKEYFNLLTECYFSTLFERISEAIFTKFIDSLAVERASSNEKVFRKVNSKAIQKFIFDLAADESTAQRHRDSLYKLHRKFPPLTGVSFVESEEDVDQALEDNEDATEAKESKKAKKRKLKTAILTELELSESSRSAQTELNQKKTSEVIEIEQASVNELDVDPETKISLNAAVASLTVEKTTEQCQSNKKQKKKAKTTAEDVFIESINVEPTTAKISPVAATTAAAASTSSSDRLSRPAAAAAVGKKVGGGATPAEAVGSSGVPSSGAASEPPADFVAAQKFSGSRPGYVFQLVRTYLVAAI